MSTQARYQALLQEVQYHSRLYHQQDAPEISDDAYDALLRELRALEAEHPDWVDPENPARRSATRRFPGSRA